jgi:membrane-bound lytic murein transglycosylase D
MHIRLSRYRLLGHGSLAPSLAGSALGALSILLSGCTPRQNGTVAQQAKPQATAPAVNPTQPTPQATADATPAAPPTSAEQKKTKTLIQQVEQAYTQGQAAYRKGSLADAKVDFDRAVDLMLSSGLDIKANQPLQDEFDRIVDGVNAIEMESLKQGNGFVPKEEPTPAEVANDVTFEVDPNISAKARADLATTKSDLPLVVNDYVDAYIKFFSTTKIGHNTLLHSFQRAGRYRAMIQRVMAEEGVPQDLIYLAVAESGFNPRAIGPRTRSGGRAGGMWQFMPDDRFYGLSRNAYVDERFDPEKSTRAYARYMKFIYNQLGDWYLSMAGYNWGTGRVQQAVQKTGYADFWELYRRNNLPGETKIYVPEIIAAIIIANNPTHYGFEDITLDPPLLTDTVTINYSVDLRLVADIVNAPEDELIALNPSMLRSVTPPDAPFDLHLPAGTSTLFNERIAAVPEAKRNAWRYHRVAADDTLASVAHEFHVSEEELASINQLRASSALQGVEALIVPVAPVAASTHVLLYTARKGDTLVTIADRFGVSLTQLRRWNKMSGIKIEPGRRLHVAEPTIPSSSPRAHRVAASSTPKAGAAKPASTKASANKAASAKSSHGSATSSRPSSSAAKKKSSTSAK